MISTRTYIEKETASFFRTGDRFGAFSNMRSGLPITAAGLDIPSTENYYQAMKFPHLPDFQAEILAETRPVPAKRLAYTRSRDVRPDWQKVNIALMRHSLRLRYGHHPHEMQDLFRESGDMPIVEISSRDDFWGTFRRDGILTGKNVLGRLWMELRDEVRDHDPEVPFEVVAPDIPELRLCGRDVRTFTPKPKTPKQPCFDI